MTRSRLSLMLALVLFVGTVVAVGAGTALGQTPAPSAVTLSTPDMNPPAGATVTINAMVYVGDGAYNPSDPLDKVSLVASLGSGDQGTLGLMAGSPYPGESCVNDPNPGGTAFTSCEWNASTSNFVFTFPVTIAPDALGVDVIIFLHGSQSEAPVAQDQLHLVVFHEETTTTTTSTTTSTTTTSTTTSTTTTTAPTTTTSVTVAPTSIVSTTVAPSTTIAEVETDLVDGESMSTMTVALLGLLALGFLTLAAAAVRARRFDG